MRERPILFNSEMVRAILSGRKTQTRRALKEFQVPELCAEADSEVPGKYYATVQKHPRWGFCASGETEAECLAELVKYGGCPFGKPGDRLWVRETLANDGDGDWCYEAKLSGITDYVQSDAPDDWRSRNAHRGTIPSIHMPRWACRIHLEIQSVRVERLQEISEEDAKAEGVRPLTESPLCLDRYLVGFKHLWQVVYGDDQWMQNPWVWVIEFKPLNKPEFSDTESEMR